MSFFTILLILFFCRLLPIPGQYNILSHYMPLFDDEEDIVDETDAERINPRISSGYFPKKEYLEKYVVSIRTRQPTGFWGDNHFCSGVIISQQLVLTAAHCVMDGLGIITRPHRLNVVAGSPYRLKKATTCLEYKVKKVIPNLNFQRKKGNDVAILILEDVIPKSNKNIKIISIRKKSPSVGTQCVTLGWGQLFWDGPFANKPFYGNLSIAKSETCKEQYGAEFTSDLLCAQNPENYFVDACRGDAGAPLICDKELVGINSFTSMCADTRPATYTDVTKYIKWIQTASKADKIDGWFYRKFIILMVFLILDT